MRIKAPPKMFLPHTIQYHAYKGINDQGNTEYNPAVTVSFVKVEMSRSSSSDKIQTKQASETTIYAYAEHTTPSVEFAEKDKIVFNRKEMFVKRVITNYDPYTGDVWGYEVEVV